MLNQSRFAYLIDITHKMIDAVERMIAGYNLFPSLVEEEHRMIKDHTYTKRLEEVLEEKTKAGEQISIAFDELQQLSQQLFLIWQEVDCEGQGTYPGDLSNCVSMLDGLSLALRTRANTLEVSVLEGVTEKLRDAHKRFKELLKHVKPMLELNRIAIGVVARNYQQSTRILLEMCEQAQATYTAQGQQTKPTAGTSTIFVKA